MRAFRFGRAALVCASLGILATGCGAVMVSDSPALLVLDSSTAGLMAFVDDVAVAVREQDGERFVTLAPGVRRVMLSADAHLPYLFEVRVSPGERLSLAVELWPVEPDLDNVSVPE